MIGLGIGVAWTFGKINRFVSNMILAFRMRVAADGGVFEAPACLAAQLEELRKDQLLSSTSLVVTPNAYKAGILYDIVPNTALGDLDVVRATSATRVDANGLVEIPRTNLILRSEEFNISPWSTLGPTTITANATTSPDGNLTADLISGADSTSNVNQIIAGTIGVVYTNSFYIKNNNSTQSQVLVRNSTSIVAANINWSGSILTSIINIAGTTTFQNVGNGWYRIISTYTAVEAPQRPRIYPTSNTNQSVYVWGAQLEVGSTATEYIPTVASIRTKFAGITQDGSSASNIPRLDYTNGSCPSILVEPQRTNLALRSEEFDNATWTTNGLNVTVSPNATTAPDGSNSADAIFTTNSVGVHYIQQRTGTATAGTTYTMSVYVKKLGYDYCQILTSNTGTGIGVFRFSTKTLTIDGPQVVANSGKVTEMADGWFRIQISILPLSSAGWRWWIQCLNDSAQESFTGDVTKGLYVWGFQFETGANATSYIPTTSASVTRNSDGLSKANVYTNGWVSSTGGTFFVDLKNNVPQIRASAYPVLFLSSNTSGTGTNTIGLGAKTTSSRLFVYYIKNGTFVESVTTTADNAKIAIAWTPTTMKIFQNGVLLTSITGITWDITTLQNLGEISQVVLNINSMALYPTALTDAQLELLTGSSFYTYDEMAIALNYNIQ